ncbi:endocuticle structural glycoprotein ABD-5-like [Diabrotica undecimpunctata]|uniref:endocuticle structural glycoprotein ABD-5-like n=1 Tax=Diabrotica undecimpunctata TaxID=50387 RepID=UPI003B632B3A
MIESLVVIVLASVVLCVQCLPSGDARIVKYTNELTDKGYNFEYETSDGIKRQETGSYHSNNQEDGILKVNGQFEYPSPDGYKVSVVFVSDEKGYRPKVSISTGPIGPVLEDIPENDFVELDNRINVGEKSISSSAIASLSGGGLGK